VHHVVPLEQNGAAFDLSNLTTVCRGCHHPERGCFLDRQHAHTSPKTFAKQTLQLRGKAERVNTAATRK
jgi:5-methylcytosine-specific restriction endonuclease McrA